MKGMALTPEQVLYMLSLPVMELASPNPGLAPYFGASNLIVQTCPQASEEGHGSPHAHNVLSLYESFDGGGDPLMLICFIQDLETNEITIMTEETVTHTLQNSQMLVKGSDLPINITDNESEPRVGMYL